MEHKVFRYRVPILFATAAFLAIWATGWISGWKSTMDGGTVKINGVVTPASDALPMLYLMLFLGIAAACAAVITFCFALTARVEVSDGFVCSYNFLGAQRVKGSLATAEVQGTMGTAVKVVTDGGSFKVYQAIQDYGALMDLLQPKVAEARGKRIAAERQNLASLPTSTFSYRWTFTHLMSFVILAFVVFFDVGWFSQESAKGNFLGAIGVAAGCTVVFGGVGVFLLLQGFNEKVILGPDGITWVDKFGSPRIQSGFDAIANFTINNSPSGRGTVASLQVFTDRGTIQVSSYIRGYSDLVDILMRFVPQI